MKQKRKQSVAVIERNKTLLEKIQALKSDHPFWGYRRIWAYLRFIEKMIVNKKRVYRLMREHNLTVTKETRLRAKRTSHRAKPRPTKPRQWWGIDMSKVMVQSVGWVYIVIVLDWYTKKIVGHYAGLQCLSSHWLEALNKGVNAQFPLGVKGEGLHLMSDNGSQPTSCRFMKNCGDMGVFQAFTSYNNPKGNADTERMFRTMKEELLWLKEWKSQTELYRELDEWVDWYNKNYLHSTHGYKTPEMVEKEFIHAA